MNKLLISLAFVATLSCATAPITMPTEGALSRQVQRVVARHDTYVKADTTLTDSLRAEYLGQSQTALTIVAINAEVTGPMLNPVMSPVMDRHDAYVQADAGLDPLDRQTFLATSSGLRSLLTDLMWGPGAR